MAWLDTVYILLLKIEMHKTWDFIFKNKLTIPSSVKTLMLKAQELWYILLHWIPKGNFLNMCDVFIIITLH